MNRLNKKNKYFFTLGFETSRNYSDDVIIRIIDNIPCWVVSPYTENNNRKENYPYDHWLIERSFNRGEIDGFLKLGRSKAKKLFPRRSLKQRLEDNIEEKTDDGRFQIWKLRTIGFFAYDNLSGAGYAPENRDFSKYRKMSYLEECEQIEHYGAANSYASVCSRD